MIKVQTDFSTRVAEIEAYFQLIKQIDDKQTLLINANSNISAYNNPTELEDLLRTCKASAFLLLYNLMESTVSNAIEAIFDEFSQHCVSFDSCHEKVRRIVIENLKQHNTDKILSQLNGIAIDVVTKTFRKEKIVSGNVDARKIKDVADEYGFPHPAADGGDLLTVKSNRNDLAHGSKSFAEVGRDHTVPDLIKIKDKVIIYLNLMLTNVANYISNKHYLATI